MNAVNAAVTAGASVYMGEFWDQKGKIPMIASYNEALESTRSIRNQLALLGIVWALSTFLSLFG
jgi:hypothetical protein